MFNNALSPVHPGSIFYPVAASTFNGSSDYIHRNSAGVAPIIGSISFAGWIKLNGGNSTTMEILNIGSGPPFVRIYRNSSNKIVVELSASGGAVTLNFESVNAYTTTSGWLNILASGDISFSAGNKLSNLYINDISDKTVTSDTGPGSSNLGRVGTASNGSGVGIGGTIAGANFLNASMSQFWYYEGYIDFSVLANRRKFISATKRPIFLGTNGLVPTNTCQIYLKDSGASFGTNYGSSGAYTTTGTLTTPTTTPSAP